MADEVGRGFYNARLFCSLFGQFISLVISNVVCVGLGFADGDIVVRGFWQIYYLGYEELIWVVILGGWVSYVVEEKICVVESICEYNCICWVCFAVIMIAYNYALRILGYPSRRAMTLTCSGPLKIQRYCIFLVHPMIVNEPYV